MIAGVLAMRDAIEADPAYKPKPRHKTVTSRHPFVGRIDQTDDLMPRNGRHRLVGQFVSDQLVADIVHCYCVHIKPACSIRGRGVPSTLQIMRHFAERPLP